MKITRKTYSLQELDEILAATPEVPPERMAELEAAFTQYIFFSKSGGSAGYQCTACGNRWEYPARTMTEADTALLSKRHGDPAQCPICERNLEVKNIAKVGQCKNLSERINAVIIIPADYDHVYARAFYVWRNFYKLPAALGGGKPLVKSNLSLSESVRYYFERGYAKAWKYQYDHAGLGFNTTGTRRLTNDWQPASTIIYPFQTGANMYHLSRLITFFGTSTAEDTYLKYSQQGSEMAQAYYPTDWFGAYSEYPQMEMLVRYGFSQQVYDILSGIKGGGALDWSEDDPRKFFNLSSQELQAFMQSDKSPLTLQIYKILKKSGIKATFADTEDFIGATTSTEAVTLARMAARHKISPRRIVNYIKKQKDENAHITYKDYLDMAGKLQYDLKSDMIIFPKKLTEAHDTAAKNYNIQLTVKEQKDMFSLTERLMSKHEFYVGEYAVIVPRSMQAIIAEGKTLNHCVGAYAHRHAKGETVILFIRKSDDIGTPFYTMEYREDKIIQIQGWKNNRRTGGGAPPAVWDFARLWLKWVGDGSRRDKEGHPILSETTDTEQTPAQSQPHRLAV